MFIYFLKLMDTKHDIELGTIGDTMQCNCYGGKERNVGTLIKLKKIHNDANKRLINTGDKNYVANVVARFSTYREEITTIEKSKYFVSIYICELLVRKNYNHVLILNYDIHKYMLCSLVTSNYLAIMMKCYKNIKLENKLGLFYNNSDFTILSFSDMFINKIHYIEENKIYMSSILGSVVYDVLYNNRNEQINIYHDMFKYRSTILRNNIDGFSTIIQATKSDDIVDDNEPKKYNNHLLIHPFFCMKKITNNTLSSTVSLDVHKNAAIIFIWCTNDYVIKNVASENIMFKHIKHIKHYNFNGVVLELFCTLNDLVNILDNENIEQRIKMCEKINMDNHSYSDAYYDTETYDTNNVNVTVNKINYVEHMNTQTNDYIYADSICFCPINKV